MGLVLDSSVLIAAERQKIAWRELRENFRSEPLLIASITLSEIWHGYHRANNQVRSSRLKFIKETEALLPVIPFGVKETLVHAELSAFLANQGEPIGAIDLIIAATAFAHNYSVATLNEREFQKVPNLRLVSVRPFLIR